MDKKQWERIRAIGLMVFLIIVASMLVYFLIFRAGIVKIGIDAFFTVLRPILYGFVLAYLLGPLAQSIENLLAKLLIKKKAKSGGRAISAIHIASVLISVVLLLLIIYGLGVLLIPQLFESIENIVRNIPTYVDNVQAWINRTFSNESFDEQTNALIETVATRLEQYLSTNSLPQLDTIVASLTSSLWDVLIFFKNLLLGLVISIYVLLSKDAMRARCKRFLYAVLPTSRANNFLDNLRFMDEKFGGFFIGKIIDSALIAIICYPCLTILRMPYALLISVIIGVTNIIPVFGPFIGAIPTAFLIFCVSPVKALYFIIFIIILQQFDGNFLGPRILGNAVGLSGFMVLIAIILGSGFFGVPGMIFAVPVAAILQSFIQAFLLRRVIQKDLPEDIEDYRYATTINPASHTAEVNDENTAEKTLYQRLKTKSALIKEKEKALPIHDWDHSAYEIRMRDEARAAERSADKSFKKKED